MSYEIYRKCYKCGETKPLGEFCRDKSKSMGRSYLCLGCKRAYQRAKRKDPAYAAKERKQRLSDKTKLAKLQQEMVYYRERLTVEIEASRHYHDHARAEAMEIAVDWLQQHLTNAE